MAVHVKPLDQAVPRWTSLSRAVQLRFGVRGPERTYARAEHAVPVPGLSG